MTETRQLLENGKVRVITTTDINRYTPKAYYASYCDSVIEDFKELCKIWTMKNHSNNYECLDTKEDWEPDEENTVTQDLESFQNYVESKYGKDKYEVYTLGAYDHSGVSFGLSKGRYINAFDSGGWDSSTIGFIAIPKDANVSKAINSLNEAWNGYIIDYEVYDELEQEFVDCTDSLDDELKEWMQTTAEKYGIDWDGVEPTC